LGNGDGSWGSLLVELSELSADPPDELVDPADDGVVRFIPKKFPFARAPGSI
jgi:hypothetical protein